MEKEHSCHHGCFTKMDRKKFLRQTALGVAGITAGISALRASIRGKSTYDQLAEPIGFNHLPTHPDMMTSSDSTLKMILHRADTRGKADHGWLLSRHTFSFAQYYHPERIHFGVLRVLNDDVVAPGRGFATHPHDNMEIISIPLAGDLEHKDSMGNVAVIREGDVQVMSAGTGVRHSEFNRNRDRDVRFLQIWVFPREKGVTPRYDQISLRSLLQTGRFNQILSPSADDQGVWIHQDAWFHLGDFQQGQKETYRLRKPGNGVYAFMIEGDATIAGQDLHPRDGLGIWDTDSLEVRSETYSRILLMEVPMQLS